MPLFGRKNSAVPPTASQPQTQQQWVAYVYAPQPVPMPSMYAPGPTYVQHPTFHHALPAARYSHLGMQYRTMPVQYIYPKSSAYPNTNPQTDYARKPYRSQSGARPIHAGDYYTDDES